MMSSKFHEGWQALIWQFFFCCCCFRVCYSPLHNLLFAKRALLTLTPARAGVINSMCDSSHLFPYIIPYSIAYLICTFVCLRVLVILDRDSSMPSSSVCSRHELGSTFSSSQRKFAPVQGEVVHHFSPGVAVTSVLDCSNLSHPLSPFYVEDSPQAIAMEAHRERTLRRILDWYTRLTFK